VEPAYSIVLRLGGPSAVSRAVGISPGGVCRWYMPQPKGCGGRIPAKYITQLCALAKKDGLFLEPNMFFLKKKKRK
jgi:hypothetical protein